MRSLIVTAALSAGLAQSALGFTGQAVAWRDAPSGGRFVGPVWMMSCPAGERLAGIRVHEDKRIAAIQPFCARAAEDGLKWAEAPTLAKPPRTKKGKGNVAYVDDEGRNLAPALGETTFADGEADRVVIVEEADWQQPVDALDYSPVGYDDPGPDAVAVEMDAVYRPEDEQQARPAVPEENSFETSYARATWGSTPYLWRYDRGIYRGAVRFQKVRGSYDEKCPTDSYVTGIRTGWRSKKGAQTLAAIQIVCARPGARDHQTIGPWPTGKDRKPLELRIERAECEGAIANPHDGDSVQTIFGAIESGRVQTIGVSCSPWQGERRAVVATASQ